MPTTDGQPTGKGPKLIREMNQRVLFDSLLRQGPTTRPELARASGLSQPTVIAALNELVEARLVVPVGNDARELGRPAKLYQANAAAASVIAIDIGRVWVRVAVVDIAGGELYRHDVRNVARSATSLVELISAEVSQAKAKSQVEPGRMHAVIGSPGVFAPKRGVVDYADQLPGWHRPRLVSLLVEELGMQVQIENDVNLAALAESIHGRASRYESFAYFHIGTGAGLATVINGRLHRGFHGAAGELAYLLTTTGADGGVRVLEDIVSARALTSSAREVGLEDPAPEAVLRSAAAGDPKARRVMDRFIEGISAAVIAINAVLDPECIILGGGIGTCLQDYVAEIGDAVARRSPFHVDLAIADLHADATLRGAIDLGLRVARDSAFELGLQQGTS
ncbi:ROK family transcriptional regulator [Tessaracoccus sp. OH4464_COT-324]|uniref:ROK family transcriptional regulator n=1 Tax=Tessaracoccus sp. OH4464_COT-324 TaxID=2491059 RepID=UPI000F6341C3|nr:ROK family transcriptional regulator [Tessaracoccus sp. OH4464_COT-324]RRD45880.1 ROK family transcriptional regulator [Tessaracoccus sp. OH4464_COT-324]